MSSRYISESCKVALLLTTIWIFAVLVEGIGL